MNHSKKIILFIVFLSVIVAVRFSSLGDFLTLGNLRRERQTLLLLVQDHYLISVLSFIAVYISVVALSIPGGAILTLAAGFLYGTALAVVYVRNALRARL